MVPHYVLSVRVFRHLGIRLCVVSGVQTARGGAKQVCNEKETRRGKKTVTHLHFTIEPMMEFVTLGVKVSNSCWFYKLRYYQMRTASRHIYKRHSQNSVICKIELFFNILPLVSIDKYGRWTR